MTSKDRMMTALHKEKPDRIPATVHQWMPYHLAHYMDGMDDIAAFRATGLDGAVTFSPQTTPETPQWRVESRQEEPLRPGVYNTRHTVHTPDGNMTWEERTDEITTFITEPMIKRDEDIYLLKKYLPVPTLDQKAVAEKYDALGNDGILRGMIMGMQGGCWQDAVEYYGTENMIMATFRKADWVQEFLEILLEKKLEFIYNSLKGARYDLIENGGGAASANVISPKLHEKYCVPFDRRVHDALHDVGYPVSYHTCGAMVKIAHLIPLNHCDASETLSPPGVGGDITPATQQEVYEKLFPKVALIGGLDQNYILEQGTPEQIRSEVHRLFDVFGKNGGYIMSASDHFFHAPRKNLEAYAQAARECTYSI